MIALIPVILTIFGYISMISLSVQFMSCSRSLCRSHIPSPCRLQGAIPGSGAVVGIIGSFLAATKYLRCVDENEETYDYRLCGGNAVSGTITEKQLAVCSRF